MNKIKIMGDSTCDLAPELVKQLDVEIFPLPVLINDQLHKDMVDVTPDDLYNHYQTTGKLAKTSAPSIADYVEFWQPWVDGGYEIIHFHISSDMSGTYNAARLAAEQIGHVHPVDTRELSSGIALLLMEACDLRDEGKSLDEILSTVLGRRSKVQASFLVDDIEYLHKGGRCSSIAAMGANLLKLHPRIDVIDGVMLSNKKYRGKTEKCFQTYADDLLKGRKNIKLDRICITHSGIDQSIIDLSVDAVKKYQPGVKKIIISRAGCSVSCHCGPNTLGILFMYE